MRKLRFKRYKKLRRLVIFFIVSSLVFGGIEWIAGQWLGANTLPEVYFRNSNRFKGAYVSQAFLDEFGKINSIWYVDDHYATKPHDLSGQWITFRDGYRVTSYQPVSYTTTVWLFGNSAMSDVEVPDNETIASYLQLALNRTNLAFRVMNVGIESASVIDLLSRMKEEPIQPGDIVILYSGSMEAYAVWNLADLDRGSKASDGLCNQIIYKTRSNTIHALCHSSLIPPPPGLLDERAQHYGVAVSAYYVSAVEEMQALVAKKHATFINVLEPHPYSASNSSDQEDPAERNGMRESYLALYSALSGKVPILDFSHLVPEEWFTNASHLNPDGNRIVAQALEKLLATF